MKTITQLIVPALAAFVLYSCGEGNNAKPGTLQEKKVELGKLNEQKSKLDSKIASLEAEIAKLDTSVSAQKPKLVALSEVQPVLFTHYLTLQGKVDQQNISYITPAGQPGQIKAIYVKQGDKVHKGQLILKLDDQVMQQNINAISQQLNSVKAQLDLAKSVYSRQQNLWNNNIGTEVQLLQAKTNVETLEGQLKAIQANVKTAQTQASQSNVYSDVNGVVDDITAHVGETFNGNPMAGGYIRIVGNSDMKITVTVPENYAGQVRKGSKVMVELPDIGKSFNGEIFFMSESVGATTRGFTVQIKVPANLNLSSNQAAVVKIQDYQAPNSIVVPLNTVQNDEGGKFVLVAVQKAGGLYAEKKSVIPGRFSGDSMEIKQGLQAGEQLITQGFQNLLNGQSLTTKEN